MYFLRRLRSFNICSKLLQMFYQSVVASVLFYTVVCWGGSISKKDTSRLDKLIRRAGSVVGTKLDSLVTGGWQSRGLWTNSWILWTMPATLCTPSSATRGACSVKDCSFPSAGPTGSRTPLSIMPSHSTTPHKGGGGHRDIELLAVSMRPYYLPREFTHALVVVVYVPPSANADAACDVLLSAVSRLQTQHPDALLLISGDFNHASPSSSLPKFTQYVTCHTRDNKTLDLFYANTKEAYLTLPSSSPGPSRPQPRAPPACV
ncbi:hypothetical protein L3Q82_020945 [Scortum barcoo]|uniref:Uncharacterized protein n=1 Tax=Scortum barcoo TaxID=214431 RepID=A0ACB8V915_9TELE|nr:hypothetical protein L3Q82_020945 [Scortum barcoo]